MKKFELVIFDMDGLMFDTELISKRAWKDIGKLNNFEVSDEFLLGLLGRNGKAIELQFKGLFGEEFPFAELYKAKELRADDIIEEEGLVKKEGLIELIDYLKANDFKIAVATSSSREKAHRLLSIAGVLEKFDKVLCGDEISKGKPDPEIFLTVCQKLDVEPSKAIVLEDSERGLEAAVAGGIACVLIPDLVEPSEKHVSLAHSKVKSLKEIIEILNS
ncbi:MAG: HAD family hydrolase [Clostridiaceae bacterium]